MKHSIKFIFIAMIQVLTLLIPENTKAQTANRKKTDSVALKSESFALLVRTEEHIKAAVKTALELQSSNKFETKHIEIIICGEAVQLLQKGNPLEEVIQKAVNAGIRTVACGMSMEKQKVSKDSLMKGIEIEPNGLIRIFELQTMNYRTIEL